MMSTRKVLFILVILGVVAALGVTPISWSQSDQSSSRAVSSPANPVAR